MIMPNNSNSKIIILGMFLLVVSCISFANKQIDTNFNYNNQKWSNLTQDKYLTNRIACETKIKEHKWSYNIWPKENKNPKLIFKDVIDLNNIHQSVTGNQYKESLLAGNFGIYTNIKNQPEDVLQTYFSTYKSPLNEWISNQTLNRQFKPSALTDLKLPKFNIVNLGIMT